MLGSFARMRHSRDEHEPDSLHSKAPDSASEQRGQLTTGPGSGTDL
jgi:hypothetical protein